MWKGAQKKKKKETRIRVGDKNLRKKKRKDKTLVNKKQSLLSFLSIPLPEFVCFLSLTKPTIW